MYQKVKTAFNVVVDNVLDKAQQDRELKGQLRILAQEVVQLTEESNSEIQPVDELLRSSPVDPSQADSSIEQREPSVDQLKAGSPLQVRHEDDDERISPPENLADALFQDVDLPALLERLRLEAKAIQWYAEKKGMIERKANYRLEIAPIDTEFFEKGTELGCLLWMLTGYFKPLPSHQDMSSIADCFDLMVEVIELARSVNTRSPKTDELEVLNLIAQTQSILRSMIRSCTVRPDDDQVAIYSALQVFTRENEVFIQSGMTLNEHFDLSARTELRNQICSTKERLLTQEKEKRSERKLFQNLEHKVSLISNNSTSPPDAWESLVPVVEKLVERGVQPSRIEFRNALLPIIDQLPVQTGTSRSFDAVLQRIEEHRTRTLTLKDTGSSKIVTQEIQEVAQLLKGETLVLIGGEASRKGKEALERAFGLKEVNWIATTEHESYRHFEPAIARPETSAVVLLTRWSSHSFKKAKHLCVKYGKPFVMTNRGYSPNQIAQAIMDQVSDQLKNRQ